MSPRKRPKRESHIGQVARVSILIVVVIALSTSCELPLPSKSLSSDKLLVLDPSDADTANTDMLAVYTLFSGIDVTLRIDLLDFTIDNAPSFTILIDSFPGGSIKPSESFIEENRWEIGLKVSPDHSVSVLGEEFNHVHEQPSVQYDHVLDIVQINLPREFTQLPGPFSLAIASHDPDNSLIADTIGPIQSDSRSPEPIPILLSFSNVFPSETPAQATRSWDGAHNGPAGERFGLRHLLEAVERYDVPIVLTDLKRPSSLRGLQILDANAWIQELEGQGLLSLPDALPYSLCEQAAELAWPDALLDVIKAETVAFGYSPATELTCFHTTSVPDRLNLPSRYRTLILTPSELTSGQVILGQAEDHAFIHSINGSPASSLSTDGGLAIDLRRQLVASLDSSNSEGVILLSGDFQRSFWGDPNGAGASLRWIAAHPWMQPITLERFGTFNIPIRGQDLDSVDYRSTVKNSGSEPQPISLQKALPYITPPSSSGLRSFAWYLVYVSHTTPECRGKVSLESIAGVAISDCEVIQASLQRGLQHLAAVREWEINQKTSQISNQIKILESDYDEDLGVTKYAGFQWLTILSRDPRTLETIFTFHPLWGSIPIIWNQTMSSLDSHPAFTLDISMRSAPNRLEIEFHDASPEASLSLPIYLPSNLLTRQETCISTDIENGEINVGCEGDFQLRMDIQHASWRFDSILDSPGRWTLVEDPNQEMPPGHFLRIPFGLINVDFNDHFTMILRMEEQPAK
jgi:hypothetical protein